MNIHVESVPGPTGPEPGAFMAGSRRIGVTAIIDRWLSEKQDYFKLKADDEGIYIIRHDAQSGHWELILYQAWEE